MHINYPPPNTQSHEQTNQPTHNHTSQLAPDHLSLREHLLELFRD